MMKKIHVEATKEAFLHELNRSLRDIASSAFKCLSATDLYGNIYGDRFKFGIGPTGNSLNGKILDAPNQTSEIEYGFGTEVPCILLIILIIVAIVFSMVTLIIKGWVPLSISGFTAAAILIIFLFYQWISFKTLEYKLKTIVKRIEGGNHQNQIQF